MLVRAAVDRSKDGVGVAVTFNERTLNKPYNPCKSSSSGVPDIRRAENQRLTVPDVLAVGW